MTSPCICNYNFPSFLSKNLLNFPSPAISNSGCQKLPFNPCHRRTSVCVFATTATDRQALPQSAIQRIVEKLRSLGYVEESMSNETPKKTESSPLDSPSPGEIFVPSRAHLPKHRVGHTLDPSWSTPENPVPEPGSGVAIQKFHELRRGVLKEEEEERLKKNRDGKRERAPTLAELTLPEDEITRLQSIGIGLKKKLKVGRVGITEGIVNGIHERWRRSELVKITCEDICRLNMKRTHDLLERKTGGLVIWRSGSCIILYRGADYKYPYFFADNNSSDTSVTEVSPDLNTDQGGVQVEKGQSSRGNNAAESPALHSSTRILHPQLLQGVGLPNRVRFQLPGEAQLAEEADKLLEGLGPRFTEWWGYDPLPIDADLLPAIVPGYMKPFRLLPYGVKPKLTNDEMTTLRRLSLPLPCHFALGRNRKLQGLAASIIKLWEKCEIAKIAIKRGVQNTNSELMAEELKHLTGGTLLSRDREFISLYRGKDFLPTAVSSAIEERRRCGLAVLESGINKKSLVYGKEYTHKTKDSTLEVEIDEEKIKKSLVHSEGRMPRLSEAIDRNSTKLSLALAKKAWAEKLLEQLENEEIPQPSETDKEGITEEERYMLRKVGLRMGAFLLLGRRGVFDGTIENMHLHWKYRELVKVLTSLRSIEEVHRVAQILEAESGGILVAIERVSKGYVIIVYRGKNYQRPASLRPRTLLSKREAMKRSLEAQRRKSLKLHVLELTKNIVELKLKLKNDEDTNDRLLTKDLNLEVEQGIVGIHVNNDKLSDDDPKSDDQLRPASEENRESHGTDATSVNPEDFVGSSKCSLNIICQPISVKETHVSLSINVQGGNIDSSMPREEPISVLKETQVSLNINEKRENVDSPLFQEKVQASSATSIQSCTNDSKVDSSNGKSQTLVSNAMQNGSAVQRPAPLSNRERLILRKHALGMKYQPVLAVGKRNTVNGVAKSIKAHFEKHPLAIVSIKGRAKGTSIKEVVYNLEQATESVLVSQEPSKVILYRQRRTGEERIKDIEKLNKDLKNHDGNGDLKSKRIESPELIAAIKLECGFQSANEEREFVDS